METRFKLYVLIIMMNIVFISMSENSFTDDVDINTRCPYSDICGRNASLQLNNKKRKPCCSSCSCSPDCGLHMNCCYEQMDKYRLVESNQMSCVNINTIYATRFETNEYYMIDKCLNQQNGGNHSSTQCRVQGGNENKMASDLTPVSSLDSGFIYFNSECARCNNVYKYTPWDYEMHCGVSFDISSPRITLQYITAHDLCDRMFVAPETEDWSARKCYTFEPNTCEIADQWLSDMCTSIYAPYIYATVSEIRMYRNIYCAMCNTNTHITLRNICATPEKTTRQSLMSVIKGSVNIKQLLSQLLMVNTTRIPKTDDGECLPHEVMHPFQNDCRYIYCPTGMYRTDNGCDYYIARLLSSFYMVQVELTPYPDTKLMTSSLKSLSLNDRKNPKRWIRSSCIDNLIALEVFSRVVDDSDTSGTVNILILRLRGATKKGFNPSVVLPIIKNCLKEKWLLTIDGTVYPFSAKLYKYNRFIQDGQSVQSSLTWTRKALPKLYERLSSDPERIYMVTITTKTRVFLSKLHFCEQVRLNMSEVEAGYGEIRILSHGLVLGSNRYITYTQLNENLMDEGVYIPNVNLTTFAVCLEDFNKKAWVERQQKQNNFKMVKQDVYLYLYYMSVMFLVYYM